MGVIINYGSQKEFQNNLQLKLFIIFEATEETDYSNNVTGTLLSESLTEVLPKKSKSPYILKNIGII